MSQMHFRVGVSDYAVSLDDWRRANAAPISELPPLSDEQKEVARKFKITEEEYARNVLAGSYGQQRMRKRAQDLGEEVQDILKRQFGAGHRVIAVTREMDRVGWVVRVETPGRDVDVFVSQELADDLLDSPSDQEREQQRDRLRVRVMSVLEQSGLTVRR